MENKKRINRKALAEAIRNVVGDQRSLARKQVTERVAKEMEMDERVLVLRSLIELHPFLKEELEGVIERLKTSAGYEAVKNMPYSWVESSEAELMRGRLELMTDSDLQKYTLEELADLVKN